MADSYFIKRGENINGPFTLKKLQKALSDKKLKANDQLAISNQGPWERLSSVHKDIKAGKHPFVADEAPVDAESIMDEWMEEQPAPTQPSPELGEPSTHDEACSLPSKPPEIVAEGDDDEHEVDDQPAPSISATGDGSGVAQDEERPPSRKAIIPIIAGGILIVALIASSYAAINPSMDTELVLTGAAAIVLTPLFFLWFHSHVDPIRDELNGIESLVDKMARAHNKQSHIDECYKRLDGLREKVNGMEIYFRTSTQIRDVRKNIAKLEAKVDQFSAPQ